MIRESKNKSKKAKTEAWAFRLSLQIVKCPACKKDLVATCSPPSDVSLVYHKNWKKSTITTGIATRAARGKKA